MEIVALIALIIFLYWREQMESPDSPSDSAPPSN